MSLQVQRLLHEEPWLSQNETPPPRRTWRQIAGEAAKETDHQKLLELIGGLVLLLEEEQKQISEQTRHKNDPS